MKKLYIFLTVLIVSCSTKQSEDKIVAEFALIELAARETKDTQKDCFDRFAEALDKLSTDKTAKINTEELIAVLQRADSATRIRLDLINQIEEADNEIKLKTKATVYIEVIKSILERELTECIEVFSKTTEDRYYKVANLLKPALDKLKVASDEYNKAMLATVEKYDLKTADTSTQ